MNWAIVMSVAVSIIAVRDAYVVDFKENANNFCGGIVCCGPSRHNTLNISPDPNVQRSSEPEKASERPSQHHFIELYRVGADSPKKTLPHIGETVFPIKITSVDPPPPRQQLWHSAVKRSAGSRDISVSMGGPTWTFMSKKDGSGRERALCFRQGDVPPCFYVPQAMTTRVTPDLERNYRPGPALSSLGPEGGELVSYFKERISRLNSLPPLFAGQVKELDMKFDLGKVEDDMGSLRSDYVPFEESESNVVWY